MPAKPANQMAACAGLASHFKMAALGLSAYKIAISQLRQSMISELWQKGRACLLAGERKPLVLKVLKCAFEGCMFGNGLAQGVCIPNRHICAVQHCKCV